MDDVKKGDKIVSNVGQREIVVARLEDIIWTKPLLGDITINTILGPNDIEDLADNWSIE